MLVTHADRYMGPPVVELFRDEGARVTASDDDVRSLYATGLFYNIRVTEEMTPEGVVLTYIFQGKPRLTDITIESGQ